MGPGYYNTAIAAASASIAVGGDAIPHKHLPLAVWLEDPHAPRSLLVGTTQHSIGNIEKFINDFDNNNSSNNDKADGGIGSWDKADQCEADTRFATRGFGVYKGEE